MVMLCLPLSDSMFPLIAPANVKDEPLCRCPWKPNLANAARNSFQSAMLVDSSVGNIGFRILHTLSLRAKVYNTFDTGLDSSLSAASDTF